MKKVFLIAIILAMYSFSFSQNRLEDWFEKKTESPKLSVGFHHSYTVIKSRDTATWEWDYLYSFEIAPHISYYPIKNIGFGVNFGFNKIYSNYFFEKELRWVGAFTRAYIPWKLKRKYLDRILFYVEVNYNRTNYLGIEKFTYPLVADNLKYDMLNFWGGLQVNIWKGITIDFSYSITTFFGENLLILPRTGIEYIFYNKPNEEYHNF